MENQVVKIFRRSMDFYPKKGDPTRTTIWIQLPNLPLDLWGHRILANIARMVGSQLALDHYTAQEERKQFARILVELDLEDILPEQIPIETDLGTHIQEVIYENLPPLCFVLTAGK